MDSPKCNLYLYLGSGMQPVDCSTSLTLPALAQYQYFESRPPFSPLAILKNPMLLMMLFSAGMMWYMPKMMEGMDPEQRAQMEKQMAMQSDPQVSVLCVVCCVCVRGYANSIINLKPLSGNARGALGGRRGGEAQAQEGGAGRGRRRERQEEAGQKGLK